MAQTDTRAGFRLPWNADRNDSDEPVSENADATSGVDEVARAEEAMKPDVIEQTAPPAARRATKLMADFSRAMQVAAEASRDETMARFTADAKAVVEEIHNGATVEVAALRRQADDDVAAVREWSKAEIARVREETDSRIALRKTALDGEVEAHAATIETRVERVGETVSAFETRMAAFFERLLAEEDPTRIATMAETMPEPPDLAGIAAAITEPGGTAVEPFPISELTRPMPEPVAGDQPDEPVAAESADDAVTDETTEAEAETAADDQAETTANDQAETTVEDQSETASEAEAAPSEPDFAAAEAEAAASVGDLDEDDRIAAKLAAADEGMPLRPGSNGATHADRGTTRVTVHGLVSVASIAAFKRTLGRAAGVATIGVSSGPDGEFIFTVTHDTSLALADAITALPGFEARITAQTDGEIEVTAHDPDTSA
jgi:hypothetical protein